MTQEAQFSVESFSVYKRTVWYAESIANVYVLEACIDEKD